jgi:hypothetical protein
VFAILCLTGGVESVFYLLFFPLVAINAYYFGRTVASSHSVAGLIFWLARCAAAATWTAVVILMVSGRPRCPRPAAERSGGAGRWAAQRLLTEPSPPGASRS